MRRAAVHNHQLLHLFAHRIGDAQRAFRIGVAQQRNEFLAAVARCQVGRPSHRGRERECDALQAIVAGEMTVQIVVLLEVVDIGHQHREWRSHAQIAPPFDAQRLVEATPVGDSGQAVDLAQLREVLLRQLEL